MPKKGKQPVPDLDQPSGCAAVDIPSEDGLASSQ
jgi:hypothetical protein